MSQKKSIGGLVSLFLLAVVGLALTPIIVSSVADVTGTGADNLTGGAKTIMEMFPLFWTILMIAIPVAGVAVYLRD